VFILTKELFQAFESVNLSNLWISSSCLAFSDSSTPENSSCLNQFLLVLRSGLTCSTISFSCRTGTWTWTIRVSLLCGQLLRQLCACCGQRLLVLLVNGSALLTKSLNQKTKAHYLIQLLLISFSTDVGITELFSVVLNPLLLGQNLPEFLIQYLVVLLLHIQVTAQFQLFNINRKWFIRSISFLNKLATY